MTDTEIMNHVDHTLLKAVSTWGEISRICDESILYHTASVCIPPSFVKRVNQVYGDKINICTVIGFPLGYNTSECKVCEAKLACEDGANEIDMVVNLGDVKAKRYENVTKEIKAIKNAIGCKILKVIIETCYLTQEEKIEMCKCVELGGADYIKTSTGFGTSGATIDDVRLFKNHLSGSVKIKAAGGVKSKDDLVQFISEGADRIGTSSAIKLLSSDEN